MGLLAVAQPSLGQAAPASSDTPATPPTHPLADVLEVEPGQTCLDAQTLLSDIRSWRDGDDVDERVSILVRGDPERPHVVSVELRVTGELVVERPFDPAPSNCANLHAVVALAIAIALDETLAAKLGVLPPEPVAQVEPGESDVPLFERRRPSASSPTRAKPALSLAALGVVSAGLTPTLTGGGALSFDIRPRPHFDVRLGAFAVHEAAVPFADAGVVDLTVSAGRVDLCWGTQPLAVRLRLCGGLAGGATIARGRGFVENDTDRSVWVAGLADVDVSVAIVGPLALELRVEGVFPFVRTTIEIPGDNNNDLSKELLPAGVLVSLGPRIEF